MDAGFYRGTNQDQDGRFTDKEKKLLQQMRFEDILDKKVDTKRINLEVVKPWITAKINDLLSIEDDVVIEYIFTQLEEKNVNPKIMQINLTGFLNAKRSREFMAELWAMLVEAQTTPDGIPTSIVEKKMQELKAVGEGIPKRGEEATASLAQATETDWKHRYDSLTGGRYGGGKQLEDANKPPTTTAVHEEVRPVNDREVRERGSGRYNRNRDSNWERDRDRRDDRGDYYRRRRSRTRSPPLPPATRHFKEEAGEETNDGDEQTNSRRQKTGDDGEEEEEKHGKKKRKHKHRHHDHSDSTDSEAQKKSKKHKKEKKKKHKRDRE